MIVTPTILISLLAYTYYQLGIRDLFNDKLSSAIAQTVEVAELYLQEHKENIRADAMAMARNIDYNAGELMEHPEWFPDLLNKQVEMRDLVEAMVFQRDQVIAHSDFSFSLMFVETIPKKIIDQAAEGEVVLIAKEDDEKVRALIKLENFVDTYLIVGRYVDGNILAHLRNAKGSAKSYTTLMGDIKKAQHKLKISFIGLALLLSVGAVLVGIKLARIISRPINKLLQATAMIKAGDFSVRVPEREARDEIAILSRAFNRMTEYIAKQRQELITASGVIDERRRFIEAVLSEISAGVLVVNLEGKIILCNTSACNLLRYKREKILGKAYKEIFPAITELIEEFKAAPDNVLQQQIMVKIGYHELHLFVKIGAEVDQAGKVENIIITFDDISGLVEAQRAAAWADVARRIAHEIKNPLTPISLAAERLKEKYTSNIESENKKQFIKYADTIVNNVRDIGAIVEEFVTFARIPQAKLAKNDLVPIINDILFTQQYSYKFVNYIFDSAVENCYILCDSAQISQVLTNLLKNSAESIESKIAKLTETQLKRYRGQVMVTLTQINNMAHVDVSDNGLGFDKTIISKISAPYVTTKEKGMGLGLAIVRKILEDHGSKMSVNNIERNNKITGGKVSFTIKLYKEQTIDMEM
jgi:two-component system nitrogen regulation sensor histidine kinase NtrY